MEGGITNAIGELQSPLDRFVKLQSLVPEGAAEAALTVTASNLANAKEHWSCGLVPGQKATIRRILLTEFFSCKPKTLVISLSVSLFLIVSALKVVSGPEFVFSAIYLIPMVFTTWFLTVGWGLVVAAASTLVLLGVNASEPHKYMHAIVPYWNAMMDFGVFLVVIFVLGEAKQLYQRERELSREDFLTGLANRRAFLEALSAELVRAKRYAHQITIAYIDLDNFKNVNDHCGHHGGDLLLGEVAAILRRSVREVDLIARLGGDEFALLLPETDVEAARPVLEKIQAALQEGTANMGPAYAIGTSVGAVSYARPVGSVEQMIERADRTMYLVKQNGKGHVVFETVA